MDDDLANLHASGRFLNGRVTAWSTVAENNLEGRIAPIFFKELILSRIVPLAELPSNDIAERQMTKVCV